MNERRAVLAHFEAEREATERRIAEGIRTHRQGDAEITVLRQDGTPLAGARVTVAQKTHEFRFGANLFMLNELETAEKNAAYREAFAALFNTATLPFYWRDLEPTPGLLRFAKDSPRIYRRPPIDLCTEFCEAHGIEPREHCLNYETWLPDYLIDAPLPVLKERLEERIRLLAERYAGTIPRWEVTNETLYPHRGRKLSAFYHERDLVEWSFRTARKYLKNNTLVINDAHCNVFASAFHYRRSAYYMQIERELLRGTPIDEIGMQFHMFFDRAAEAAGTRLFYTPSHLFTVMDTYAELGLPLGITEVTVPAYSEEREDEELQAEILEWLYSIWFSHPAMREIVYWNLVDGYAAFAPQGDMTAGENRYFGGLLRFDLTEKPAYRRLSDLVHKRWHTEKVLVTDADGICRFCGFFGEYTLKIEAGGDRREETVLLPSSGERRIRVTV